MRPLDWIPSLKVKLGIVIVATVVGTVAMLYVGRHYLDWHFRTSAFAALVLGLALVQFLARGMTSPLRDMAAAAQAMARGDHSRRVRATSADEVGDLARAFNQMAADLADVDRSRRELVANVSHELRTPIGALQALLENLVDGVAPPDPHALQTALAQTERLGRLVEQLLDLSRLEEGKVPLSVEPFGVGELFEQSAREVALAGHAVDVVIEVEPPGLKLRGDVERVHQVVTNLVENAVRHSPAAGRVWLRGRASIIEVADEGPGIAPEDLQKIFERFEKGGSGDGGTGLGLAIARGIVDAHGGTIRAESRQPHGCCMIVELP